MLALVAFVALRGADGCFGRCGNGTRCEDHKCVVATVAAAPVVPQEKKRRGHHEGNGAAPELQLKPGDEKMTVQGDTLGRPEHIDFSQPDAVELSQDDIDRVFNPGNPRIISCITDAIGDYPLDSGKVVVGLRIEKDGRVSKVRVDAPALLARQGVYRCIRSLCSAMRFAASGGAQVVTYDFGVK